MYGKDKYNNLDGELLYGDWWADNVFNLTTQVVMSTELKPEFSKAEISFAVFDYICDKPYSERYQMLKDITCKTEISENVFFVDQELCYNEEDLLIIEAQKLKIGYEGIMVRGFNSPYKQGRSTLKEGFIGKLKRFSDDEAVVIGFEEKMTNSNPKLTNELGYSQRSQAQEGMVGAGTLGALICTCNGITFTMGSGLDDAGRDEVWQNKEKYLGSLAKFKYFAIGMVNSYRFPIFLGFRDKEDMS